MKLGFLCASLLLLASLQLNAQIPRPRHILYVDGVHGNDSNNCKSRKATCKTISRAISLASPDDAILVGPATYAENLTINFNLGIIGSGAGTTIIDGQALNPVININDGQVVLSGFTIRNGSSGDYAGGIQNYGTAKIFDSIITENVGDSDTGDCLAGGIYNGGSLALIRTTVTQNETIFNYYSCGSGILNNGTLAINDSTVSDNVSKCATPEGAGIYNGGTLIINRSTISGNQTGEGAGITDGGGISNYGRLVINNSTLYGNGTAGGVGGGIANEHGTVTINNSTISGNDAYYGGGGVYNVAKVNIQDSILSDNGGNCYGSVTSEGYNLSSDSTCNLKGPGDLNNTEPNLGGLRNNGGPTKTMAELPGSPTIDAGNPNGCTDGQGHLLTTDQRGAPRPGKYKHDKRCDMGAFEVQHD